MAKAKTKVETAEAEIHSIRTSRPSTDANVFLQLLVGVAGTVLLSLAVLPLKASKVAGLYYIYAIINLRGPVQYLELLMAFMVAMMLVLKGRILKRNLAVVATHPLPADVDLTNDKQLQDLRDSLAKRPEFSWSIILTRLDRAIALWLGSKDVGRVSSWAQAESSRDSSAADSSYALARVLMWAIPILGFIGTVQGLGQAVAGFGVLGGGADVSAIKKAISTVTVGLGVAFDTTLLALVLTTFLMFPLTSFQRREENLFGEMDNYLDDVFLCRLPSQEQQPIVIENLEDSIEAAFRRYIPDPDRYDEVFTRSIEKAAGSVEEKFTNLTKGYEQTLGGVTNLLTENLNRVGASLENTLRAAVDDVQRQDAAMLEVRRKIGEEETLRLKGSLQEIQQTAGSLQAAARDSVQGVMGVAKELTSKMDDISRLAAGIQDLLRIQQVVEKSIGSMAASDEWKKTLEDMRRQLSATTDLCGRLSRPRVITLKEE